MKPAEITITYVVYSPDYKPGISPYKTHIESLIKAHEQARKYGVGSEIMRCFKSSNRRGTFYRSDHRPWVYIGEKPLYVHRKRK